MVNKVKIKVVNLDNKEVEDEIAEWSLEVIQRHANGDLTQEIGALFNQQNDDNVDTKKRKSSNWNLESSFEEYGSRCFFRIPI